LTKNERNSQLKRESGNNDITFF